MTKRILVWVGKHDTVYYDASTDEALANASLDLLRTWLDDYEYIYEPTDPFSDERLDSAYTGFSRETLEWAQKELVEETDVSHEYNKRIKKSRNRYATIRDEYQHDLAAYRVARRLVDEWDTSTVTPEPRMGATRMIHPKPYIKAWSAVKDWDDYEYQHVSLVTLEEVKPPMKMETKER